MKLEIVKVIKAGTAQNDSNTNTGNWWKEPFVAIEPEDDTVTLTVSKSKALIAGTISLQSVKQLKYAGYSLLKVDGETKIYHTLYIPLSQKLKWEGIKTILENCGYQVIVVT